MHENGRLYFEGNAGENAPANMKNAPAAIKTGVTAESGITGAAEAQDAALDGGRSGESPLSAGVSSAVFIVPMLFPKPMCPLKADQKAEAPPATTSKTPRISLAVISLYHSFRALSIKSRKKPAQQPVPGRCAYAYRLPGWRGMYVPMGPAFISPWSTASVPRR